MTEIVSGVRITPLAEAGEDLVEACVASVEDALPQPAAMLGTFLGRRESAREGNLPPALWMLTDELGAAGWVGWAPYKEIRDGWQTTTYFTERLRGRGLLPPARCLQVHAIPSVRSWLASRGGGTPVFVSSIAMWNSRSQRASSRYAREQGWPDTWEAKYEPIAQRAAFVFTWPQGNPPHRCRQTCSPSKDIAGELAKVA